MTPLIYYLGFTTEVTRSQFLSEPTAPSNYGKDAAAKYITKKKQEQAEDAKMYPGIAGIASVCVYKPDGKRVFHSADQTFDDNACHFWHWLYNFSGINKQYYLSALDELMVTYPGVSEYISPLIIFGFRIKEFMRIAALSALASAENIPVPASIWRDQHCCCDPYTYLFDSESRKRISLAGAIELVTARTGTDEFLFNDPALQAKLAMRMVSCGQILESKILLEKPDEGKATQEAGSSISTIPTTKLPSLSGVAIKPE